MNAKRMRSAPEPTRSRYGRQPFVVSLFVLGKKITTASRELGYDTDYVRRVSIGRTAPSSEFRKDLGAYLGADEGELFTPEALAAHYLVRKDSRGIGIGSGGSAGPA